MQFSGHAGPEQLAVLGRTLDEFCRERGIGARSREREEAARLLVDIFKTGVECPEGLRKALDERIAARAGAA